MDELIIIHVSQETTDEGHTFPTTKICRYDIDPIVAEIIIKHAEALALEGGQLLERD